MPDSRQKAFRLTALAVLIAIMALFAFTPIGYLKVGVIEITFMILPVAIGAALLGPAAGALLGLVFGVTSALQAFLGLSVFGAFLVELNPILTVILCVIPRILTGFLAGLICRLFQKKEALRRFAFAAASLSTALLNTLFFMGCLILFFWKSPAFLSTMQEWKIPTDSVWVFLIAFVGLNGLVEAVVNTILGTAVATPLAKFFPARETK